MKQYTITKKIRQCGDCKDSKFSYIHEGVERGEMVCMRTGTVIETIVTTDENRWTRRYYKNKSNIGWFPEWCPLEDVKKKPATTMYLVCLDGHDTYEYFLIEAASIEDMKKIVKEYCRLHYGNMKENFFKYSSHIEIADTTIDRFHEVLTDEFMQELRDDANPKLLKEYDDRMREKK